MALLLGEMGKYMENDGEVRNSVLITRTHMHTDVCIYIYTLQFWMRNGELGIYKPNYEYNEQHQVIAVLYPIFTRTHVQEST